MGAGLVNAAYEVAERLSLEHAPTRVFVYMAVRALDGDPQPAFWEGYDALARALGKSGPAGHRAAGRAIQALKEAGAIRTVGHPAPGSRTARYALLDGRGLPLAAQSITGRSPSDDDNSHDAHRPVNTGRSAPNTGRSGVNSQDAHRPAEEKEEDKEEGPPPSTCPRHPNGTSEPCGACGAARRAAEAWRPPRRPAPPHAHRFDPGSGYCACGIREDLAS